MTLRQDYKAKDEIDVSLQYSFNNEVNGVRTERLTHNDYSQDE